MAPDVKLDKIAGLLPTNVTGADLYAVCSNAWFSAVRKTIVDIEKGLSYLLIHLIFINAVNIIIIYNFFQIISMKMNSHQKWFMLE